MALAQQEMTWAKPIHVKTNKDTKGRKMNNNATFRGQNANKHTATALTRTQLDRENGKQLVQECNIEVQTQHKEMSA